MGKFTTYQRRGGRGAVPIACMATLRVTRGGPASDGDFALTTANLWVACRFVPSADFMLDSVRPLVLRVGTGGGDVNMAIRPETTGNPGAVQLSVAHLDPSTWPTSDGEVIFPMPPVLLTNGTAYWAVLNALTGFTGNQVQWAFTNTGSNSPVAYKSSNNGTSWASISAFSLARFTVWGCPA